MSWGTGDQRLYAARAEAHAAGLLEIYHNPKSRLVSFAPDGPAPGALTRLNVYYTTGTVGTCLGHPRQSKTQLFRRNVGLALLRELMHDPRLHTGTGYHRRQQPEPASSHWQGGDACGAYLECCDDVYDFFSPEAICVATNGSATVMLYEHGSPAFTAGLPSELHNKLKGRQLDLPPPICVALGSEHRYYILFADGKSGWCG